MLWLQNEATKEIYFPQDNSFGHIPGGTYILSIKMGSLGTGKRSLHSDDDDGKRLLHSDNDDIVFIKEEPGPSKRRKMKPVKPQCLVCHAADPVKPVLALCCNQIIGCATCISTWLHETNVCPLCCHDKPKTIFVKGFGN